MNMHDPQLRAIPANIEVEQAVLGTILMSNAVYDAVAPVLDAEHFYDPLHRRIYGLIGKMISSGQSVSPITLRSFLPADEVISGDITVAKYLALLAASAMPVKEAPGFARVVHAMWVRRQAIAACEEVVSIAYDLDPDKDILTELEPVENRITELRAERIRADAKQGAGRSYIEAISAAYKQGAITGVPICLREIGDVISEPCLEAGNLYGLLSSSGEGKTSLTIQMIVHALKKGHPVLFLSYDQSSDQCIRQMVAQEHGIEARRQRNPKMLSENEWATCVEFGNWIDTQPFELVKCTDHSAAQLVGFAKTFLKRRANGQVPLIVVDHIGSVKPEDRRADEGTKAKEINKVFKAGAELTGAAWLVLNQRNSYGMKRDNPRPISADLFGGDPAKQAYDAIFYVYRFKKFLEERKAIASSDSDWKKINKIFPSAVREEGIDIAEIGAIKVRFGSPHITQQLIFEDRLTRYRSERAEMQEGLL
jgi:replicative DNA helicase